MLDKEKKKPGDKAIQIRQLNNLQRDNPMDYSFPELEEYFIYNPKVQFPTANPTQLSGQGKGIKMTKDSVVYCTSGSCR